MLDLLKTTTASATALVLSTVAASAQSHGGWSFWDWYYGYTGGGSSGSTHQTNAVPEIDAGSGLLAIAAVLAATALVWEIKRRRA